MIIQIPDGWKKLTKQMLIDLNKVIPNDSKFRISCIKEKFNELRVYINYHYPEADKVIEHYEQMAKYVCARCGAPATKEAQDYWLSFCVDCQKDCYREKDWQPIELEKNPIFKEEWERLMRKD